MLDAPHKSQRFLCLDAVRAFAALSVLLSHWGNWTAPIMRPSGTFDWAVDAAQSFFAKTAGAPGGLHPGVVVFIVLSGFCIHLPVATDPSRTASVGDWDEYFRRRMLRIAPVYWFASILGIVALFLANRSGLPWPGSIELAIDWTKVPLKLAFLGSFSQIALESYECSRMIVCARCLI